MRREALTAVGILGCAVGAGVAWGAVIGFLVYIEAMMLCAILRPDKW